MTRTRTSPPAGSSNPALSEKFVETQLSVAAPRSMTVAGVSAKTLVLLAVLVCGVFMVVYVVLGGMLATTWVQIGKACMLMIAGAVVAKAASAGRHPSVASEATSSGIATP